MTGAVRVGPALCDLGTCNPELLLALLGAVIFEAALKKPSSSGGFGLWP